MLNEERVPAAERYQRLIELSRDLASTLNLDALLNRIVQAAAALSEAEAASIMLFDEVNQQLYFHSATNIDKPVMRGLIVPVEGSIAGWIYTNKQPVIVSDVRNDPRYYGHIEKTTQFTTNSILGVPLITKDKVVGVLEAINQKSGNFNEDDQEVLMTLGGLAAVAIENARLFQQSDLIAEFVHELRTPLASLNAAAHLLTRPEVSDTQHQQMAEVILEESRRLSEMATSFLDLARLESGRTIFEFETVLVGNLLEECARVIQLKTNELGLRFDLDLPPTLPSLEADRDKLKQVILNMLSNAYKYNRPGGSITLLAGVSDGELVVEVRDTGRGIAEEDLPRLFEKFYRLPGTDKSTTGTGLGLSISKKIVEAHGGRITVESQVGKGTSFYIHLPTDNGA